MYQSMHFTGSYCPRPSFGMPSFTNCPTRCSVMFSADTILLMSTVAKFHASSTGGMTLESHIWIFIRLSSETKLKSVKNCGSEDFWLARRHPRSAHPQEGPVSKPVPDIAATEYNPGRSK